MELSKEQKIQLYEDGYIVIPGAVPQHLVHNAVKAINHSLGQGFPPEKVPEYRSRSFCPEVQSTQPITDLFHRSSAPGLLGSVIELEMTHPVGGGQIALRFPNSDSTPQPAKPHIDGRHSPLNGVPAGKISNFTALVGVLLNDLPSDNAGNFTVWPGSHHQFEAYFREHGPETLNDGLPPVELPEPVQVKGNAGDLILAQDLLAHGVTPNISPFTRYAIFFRIKHIDITPDNWQDSMKNMWMHWPGMSEVVSSQ